MGHVIEGLSPDIMHALRCDIVNSIAIGGQNQ